MKKKPSLEARLRKEYTKLIHHTWNPRYVVRLKVGCQEFTTGPDGFDSKQEAEWFRTMLAKALAKIVEENK